MADVNNTYICPLYECTCFVALASIRGQMASGGPTEGISLHFYLSYAISLKGILHKPF